MKHKQIDLILLPIAILLLMYSGYQLFFFHDVKEENEGQEIIAKLENYQIGVKRKVGNQLAWTESYDGENYRNQDWMYVHDGSKASLIYANGLNAFFTSATLVKIEGTSKDPLVTLNKGQMVASFNKTATSFKFKSGGKVWEINSTDGQVGIDGGSKGTEIKVVSGDISLKTDKGEKKTISKGKMITVDAKSGGMVETIMPVEFISPHPGEVIWFLDFPQDLSLQWRGEAFTEFDGKKVQSSGKSINIKREGKYLWKVISKKDPSINIASFIQINYLQHPKMISPYPGKIEVPNQNDQAEIRWEWSGVTHGVINFELQIDDDEPVMVSGLEFKKLVSIGDHKTRIRSVVDEKTKSNWSEWVPFTVKNIPIPQIADFKPDRDLYEITVYTQDNFNDLSFDFMWAWDQGENYMSIKSDGLNGEKLDFKTITTKWNFKPATFGDFKILFTPWDPMGREVRSKKEIRFNLTDGRSDILDEKFSVVRFELKRPDQDVQFKWTDDDGSVYEFILSKSADFKNKILSKKVKGNSYKVNIPEMGEYFYQVKSVDGQHFAKPVKIEVAPSPPPTKPSLEREFYFKIKKQGHWFRKVIDMIFPEAHAETDDRSESISIDLPSFEEAKLYHVQIFRDNQMKVLYLEKKLSRNKLQWTPDVAGTYFWRLAYIDYWDRQGPWSDLSKIKIDFDIKKVAKPEPPPMPILTASTTTVSLPSELNRNRWAIFYTPVSIQSKNDGANANISASGTSLNGFLYSFKKDRWSFELFRQSAKYSNQQKWNSMGLNLRRGWYWKNFILSANFQYQSLTSISYSAGNPSSASSGLISVGPWLDWNPGHHTFSLSMGMGQQTEMKARWWYYLSNQWIVGLQMATHSFKSSGVQTSVTEQQLMIGWSREL